MFGDGDWIADRTEAQWRRYAAWLNEIEDTPVVAVELGAARQCPRCATNVSDGPTF
jgi:hypothetical protein